jgi:hypothetical protein
MFDSKTKYIPIYLPYKQYTSTTLIETIQQCLLEEGSLIHQYVAFTLSENGTQFSIKKSTFPSPTIFAADKTAWVEEYFPCIHAELAVLLGLVNEETGLCDSQVEKRVLNNHNYYWFHEFGYVYQHVTETKKFNIKLKENLPKIIKVEINHVQPVAENNSHVRILSYHALNMINSHLHYVQCNNPHYLTLSSNHINEFTIRLLDENNTQLKLDASLPTILKMNLRKYEESTGEFNVIIDSTKKNAYYPSNSGSDFCVNLTPPIQLEDDYVCSISSISYATYFKTLPISPKESYIKVRRRILGRVLAEFIAPFNPLKKPLFSIQDVLDVLNENCKVPGDHPQVAFFQHDMLEKGCASFALITQATGKSFVSVGGYLNTTYDLPQELKLILGESEVSDHRDTSSRWVFELNESIAGHKNFGKRHFANPPDFISLIPQTLWIYSDIIQPVQVGDSQTNLLQIVPVRSDAINRQKNIYITEFIERPNWSQVRTRTLNKLRFKILRSDGKAIGFEKENDGVIISLNFRKMPQTKNNNLFYFS